MERDITVSLAGLPYEFDSIISASIALASNSGGTTLTIRLADPNHFIGNAIIKHSMATGGLQAMPEARPPSNTSTPTAPGGNLSLSTELKDIKPDAGTRTSYTQSWASIEVAIVKEALRRGIAIDDQIVYMLATAAGETGNGQDMVEMWDGKGAQATYDGMLGNDQPGDGYKYRGRGLAQLTGKGGYRTLGAKLGVDLVADPDILTQPAVAVPVLVAGMLSGVFTGRKLGKYITTTSTDFYNARRVINGIVPNQVSRYLNLAKYYQTRLPALKQQAAQSPSIPAGPGVGTVAKAAPTKTEEPDLTQTTVTPPVKGNMLTVQWFELKLQFYHTGTDLSSSGETTITGQGLRWILARRNRTSSAVGLTLSQLAAKVERSQGIKIKYEAAFDPNFVVVEQAGISDYALLKREAGRAGLYITEEPGQIVIKSLSQLKDTAIIIEPGANLIAYQIRDKAMTANDAQAGQAPDTNLTNELKGIIDPLTGKLVQKVPDVDTTKGATVSGTAANKTVVQGELNPGQELLVTQNLQRTKRVQGLPSQFTVVQDKFIRTLTPISVLRTRGISEYLNRVWMIEKVTHNSDGTSVIDCYSPVDVIDTRALADAPAVFSPAVGPTQVSAGQWIIPTTGLLTSPFGMRAHPVTKVRKPHKGVDIAAAPGTPITATQSGIVTFAGTQSGYGQTVIIDHGAGFTSLYGHLSRIDVQVNQQVTQGMTIAGMGSTGLSTGPHLHFEIRKNGVALNPISYGLPSLQVVNTRVTAGGRS